jgi:hypothetical protein
MTCPQMRAILSQVEIRAICPLGIRGEPPRNASDNLLARVNARGDDHLPCCRPRIQKRAKYRLKCVWTIAYNPKEWLMDLLNHWAGG